MVSENPWSNNVELLEQALSSNGAFLIARDQDNKANPMTIGWAQVGRVWSIPVLTVFVRRSRYSYSCVARSKDFSVSVPHAGKLKDALLFCGTKSGRDTDKAEACNLTYIKARKIDTPVIEECGLHYECRTVVRKQLEAEDFCSDFVLEKHYPDNNHHLVVIGEIVASYATH